MFEIVDDDGRLMTDVQPTSEHGYPTRNTMSQLFEGAKMALIQLKKTTSTRIDVYETLYPQQMLAHNKIWL